MVRVWWRSPGQKDAARGDRFSSSAGGPNHALGHVEAADGGGARAQQVGERPRALVSQLIAAQVQHAHRCRRQRLSNNKGRVRDWVGVRVRVRVRVRKGMVGAEVGVRVGVRVREQ